MSRFQKDGELRHFLDGTKAGLPRFARTGRHHFELNISRHWQSTAPVHQHFPTFYGVRCFLNWRFLKEGGPIGVLGIPNLGVTVRLAGFKVLHFGVHAPEEVVSYTKALHTAAYLNDPSTAQYWQGYPPVVKESIIFDFAIDTREIDTMDSLTLLHAQTESQEERFRRTDLDFRRSLKAGKVVPGVVPVPGALEDEGIQEHMLGAFAEEDLKKGEVLAIGKGFIWHRGFALKSLKKPHQGAFQKLPTDVWAVDMPNMYNTGVETNLQFVLAASSTMSIFNSFQGMANKANASLCQVYSSLLCLPSSTIHTSTHKHTHTHTHTYTHTHTHTHTHTR